jgi:hypothetical protein
MKTNKQIKKSDKTNTTPGLENRTEQLSTGNSESKSEAQAPVTQKRPFVDYAKRHEYRQLPIDQVVKLLSSNAPALFDLAEVVGSWIWITFPEPPAAELRQQLAQFGFHWNNTRQCWQHPCGQMTDRSPGNPREKYRAYFPADLTPADMSNPHHYNGTKLRTAEEVAA